MFGGINAALYNPLYLLLMAVVSVLLFVRLSPMGTDRVLDEDKGDWQGLILTIILVLFLGLRPLSGRYFGDMGSYNHMYKMIASGMETEMKGGDILFTGIVYFLARLSLPSWFFFLFMEIIYIVPIFLACRRLSKENQLILIVFAFSAMSFFTYGTNGIRNGAASSLFLLAITYLPRKRPLDKVIFAFLAACSFFMHASMILPIMASLAAYFVRNPKAMFWFWGGSFVVSLFAGGLVSDIFSSLGFEERLSSYVNAGGNVEEHILKTGFRWDFLLYSSMPVFLGWFVIFKKRIYTRTYALLLGTYMYANAFWIMIIRAPYSNRFAYLSWFLYPIALAYPMLVMPVWKKAPGLIIGIIMLGHMAFSILMWYMTGRY